MEDGGQGGERAQQGRNRGEDGSGEIEADYR